MARNKVVECTERDIVTAAIKEHLELCYAAYPDRTKKFGVTGGKYAERDS